MLVDAANVDPFLEGRRPRHVWSHQLRLRPANVAAESGGNGSGNGSTFVSCLGPSGEQALFESLSSGPEGAFVAWVKGGHETRQECKRLVVDVLDLLAAPGGQTAGFFQRGAQARRPPGGRVGIAANATSKTATTKVKATEPSSPAAGKDLGDELPPSDAVGTGDNHPTLVDGGERNAEVGAPGSSIVHAGTGVEGNEQREGGEQDKVEQAMGAVGGAESDRRTDAAAEGRGPSGLTYGYASLRKIREREPLPEVRHDFKCSKNTLLLKNNYCLCLVLENIDR